MDDNRSAPGMKSSRSADVFRSAENSNFPGLHMANGPTPALRRTCFHLVIGTTSTRPAGWREDLNVPSSGYCMRFIRLPELLAAAFFLVRVFRCPAMPFSGSRDGGRGWF
jgi:hypothetical protein